MLYSLLFASGILILATSPQKANGDDKKKPDFSTVRKLLQLTEFKSSRQALVEFDFRALEAYQLILSDPNVTDHEVSRIFGVVALLKGDRKLFLEYAVRSLANKNAKVRWTAVALLAEIGGISEASPVVALLSDGKNAGDIVVAYSAAETLAAIGGSREVIAMDAWLIGSSHSDNKQFREHVRNCRDELAARLSKGTKEK